MGRLERGDTTSGLGGVWRNLEGAILKEWVLPCRQEVAKGGESIMKVVSFYKTEETQPGRLSKTLAVTWEELSASMGVCMPQ